MLLRRYGCGKNMALYAQPQPLIFSGGDDFSLVFSYIWDGLFEIDHHHAHRLRSSRPARHVSLPFLTMGK